MWNKEDKSFKTLLNKRSTSALKAPYEEYGDFTLDISFSEIKTDNIPFNDPAAAVTLNIAKKYTFFELTQDVTVADAQSFYAIDALDSTRSQNDNRLRDWISDKYGALYSLHLYDNSNNEIYPNDPCGWIFDGVTGVLNFNGSTSGFLKPFKISGFRYVGSKGGNVGSGGSGGSSDTLYDYTVWSLDNLTPPSRRVTAIKINELENLLNLLSPPHASALGTLSIANTILYSARLPKGLPSSWYASGVVAGSVINTLVYDNTFSLYYNSFKAGKQNTPDTYGVLTSTITNSSGSNTISSYDMTKGEGNSGDLSVSNIGVFNNIWSKADANLQVTQLEGYYKYTFSHTEAGTSNPTIIFFDPTTILPTIPASPTVSIRNKVSKWLSGIELFGLNSELFVSYSVNNLFSKAYMLEGATQISCPAVNTLNADPAVVPNYDAVFNVVNKVIAMSIPNVSSTSPLVTVVARKPNNLSAATASSGIRTVTGLGINTYDVVSTPTVDYFQDEANRVYYNTNNPFVSSAVLPNGEAVVYNGTLSYGKSFYGSKIGLQRYDKKITKVASPSGEIKLSGISYSDISAAGTGALNVLIQLEAQSLFFDLAKPFSVNNGTGTGNSITNSKGCFVSQTDDGFFNFSFGTYSTADNNNIYRVIIIFRSETSPVITRLETR